MATDTESFSPSTPPAPSPKSAIQLVQKSGTTVMVPGKDSIQATMVQLLCDGVLCHVSWWLTTFFALVFQMSKRRLCSFVDHKLGVGTSMLTFVFDNVAVHPDLRAYITLA